MSKTRRIAREQKQVDEFFRSLFAEFIRDEESLCDIKEGHIEREFGSDIFKSYNQKWKNFAYYFNINAKHSIKVNMEWFAENVKMYRNLRANAEAEKHVNKLKQQAEPVKPMPKKRGRPRKQVVENPTE